MPEHQEGKRLPKAIREKRIPAKIRHALDLYLEGRVKDKKAAAAAADISREHFSRSLKFPHIAAYCDRRVEELLREGKIKGAVRLLELMDSPAQSTAFDAVKLALAINGIKPAEQPAIVNNVSVLAGYIIDCGQPLEASGPVLDLDPGEPEDGK